MKSRWLTNLLLFTAVVALSLVARYEPGLDKPQELRLTPLAAADITHIELQRPVRERLIMNRDDDGRWWLAREPRLPAEPHQIQALTRLAEQRVTRRYDASELELSRLELDPPRASLTLNDTRIDFGGLEPLENLRYLRVGNQVSLVPDIYMYLVEARYTNFVRRRLLPPGTRIQRLRLPEIELLRGDKGWVAKPERGLSGDTLQQFIDDWQNAAAINIREAAEKTTGEPIELELSDGSRLTLVLAAREPELVLVRPDLGLEYRLGSAATRLLRPQAPGSAPETGTESASKPAPESAPEAAPAPADGAAGSVP